MCCNPITIYNRSTYLNPFADSVFQTVPCGNCPECRENRQQEYLFRAWYHYQDVMKHCTDAFAFFDTLTYNDESLKKRQFFGIPCFDRRDITNFFKRLRQNLKRDNYDIVGNLSYFLTCEYGTTPDCSHRPHYHVIFYSRVPGLDVVRLKHAINASWREPVKNPRYGQIIRGKLIRNRYLHSSTGGVITRRLGFTDSWNNLRKHVINGIGAMYYVSKYVNKDMDYVNVVNQKVQAFIDKYGEDSDKVLALKEHLKDIYPFHRQSAGFGLGFLPNRGEQTLLRNFVKTDWFQVLNENTGMVENLPYHHFKNQRFPLFDNKTLSIVKQLLDQKKFRVPDQKKMFKEINLPLYYLRKLFYERVPNGFSEDGKPKWRWQKNNLCIQFQDAILDHKIELKRHYYNDLFANIEQFFIPSKDYDSVESVRKDITHYMAGRSWSDFALYVVAFRNHLIHDFRRFLNLDLNDYKRFYHFCNVYKTDRNFFYNGSKSLSKFNKDFRKEMRACRITQNSRHEFRDFDFVYEIFENVLKLHNSQKVSAIETQQHITQHINSLLKQ